MESKYYLTWEEYQQRHLELEGKPKEIIEPKMKKYEDIMLNFFLSLLM